MNPALHDRMVKEKLDELPFKDWLERMKILNQAHLKRITDVAEEAACLSHRNDSRMLPSSSSCGINRPATVSTTSTTGNTTTKPVPKLTDLEHQLLCDHEGCFKCQHFYVSH